MDPRECPKISGVVEAFYLKEECGNCRFWQGRELVDEPNRDGPCRRYPPVRDDSVSNDQGEFVGENAVFWVVPSTNQGDWCGEWEAKRLKLA